MSTHLDSLSEPADDLIFSDEQSQEAVLQPIGSVDGDLSRQLDALIASYKNAVAAFEPESTAVEAVEIIDYSDDDSFNAYQDQSISALAYATPIQNQTSSSRIENAEADRLNALDGVAGSQLPDHDNHASDVVLESGSPNFDVTTPYPSDLDTRAERAQFEI